MAQDTLVIDTTPPLPGDELVDRINSCLDALATNSKGGSRPGGIRAGQSWTDDSGSVWLVYLFTGAEDLLIGIMDPAGLKVRPCVGPSLPAPSGLSCNNFGADPINDWYVSLKSCVLSGPGGGFDIGPFSGTIQMDLASGQAGRLTTGAFAANTWYYTYLQGSPTTDPIVVADPSPTSPTMLGGRTHSRLLGAFRSTTGPAIISGRQTGDVFIYDDLQQIQSYSTIQNWSDISCATRIPPISSRGLFSLFMNNANSTSAAIRRNGSTASTGKAYLRSGPNSNLNNNTDWCDTDANQVIEVYLNTNGGLVVYVSGYQIIF